MSETGRIAMRLRALTPARVGLGRSGVSQVTRDVLSFQLSHAQARDAVHARLDTEALADVISGLNRLNGTRVVRLHSAAVDRAEYLQRPDLGRRLDESSYRTLEENVDGQADLAVVIADGLSALAVERHAAPLLDRLLPRLAGRNLGPLCIVEQGRVAIGDEIGQMLRAKLSVVLIGERPGLSSPDSLGAYITWAPRTGRTDAERVCISNIRAAGLGYDEAAEQLERAMSEAFQHQLTGVALSPARELNEGR
jgi:ethanolamine ammonia-lyase small subunit